MKEKRKPTGKIDVQKALELRLKGLSYEDIGKHFGVSKMAVCKRLKDRLPDKRVDLEAFKRNRADLLASKQKLILDSMTQEQIEKIPPQSRPTAFGILYDKERLERGQSTQNVEVIDHAEAEKVRLVAREMARKRIHEAIDAERVEVIGESTPP